MIEKSVFQKRINQPTRKQISHDENQICKVQNNQPLLKDISNSIQPSQKPNEKVDYKDLYEHEQHITEQLTLKIQILQQKIRLLQTENFELKQKLKQENEQIINQSSLHYISLNKKSHKQLFFEEIRSFKQNLPNSMKVIEFEELQNFQSVNFLTDEQITSKNDVNTHQEGIDCNQQISFHLNEEKSIANSAVTLKLINDQSLIDCLALYGLSEEAKLNQDEDEYFYEGDLTYCSKAPHQIVKHSSKLAFPNKTKKQQIQFYSNEEAVEYAVSLVSQTLKSTQLKAFTLIFEPAMMPNEEQFDIKSQFSMKQAQQSEIIDLINKERRFYAICIAFQDFDLVDNRFPSISFQNSIDEDIFNSNILELQKQEKTTAKFFSKQNEKPIIKQSPSKQMGQNDECYKIKVSRKVITFFTKYPFIHFFQDLLIHCLKESFQSRKNEMKKNITQLKNFDHTKTIDFLKVFYQNLNLQFKLNKKFQSKLNEIFQIQVYCARLNRFQTLALQLSKTLLKNFYSQIWAYPVLRLFNLDNFLDVLTLIMLEQKIIFVCENQHILTSAIFLFTKVLIKPFEYPYPVVSIIPNEYDYFNAPFPIVYGCLNSKQNLVRQKIPKIYKNVYIVLTPSGVQILGNKNSSKIQTKKSPKLRDKLLPYFIKMQSQQKEWSQQKIPNAPRFSGLSSLLGLNSAISPSQAQPSTKNKFVFSNNNRQLTHQIIEKVFHYFSAIKEKLPSKDQVNKTRQTIQNQIDLQYHLQNKNIDLDKQTYERIKNKLLRKTSDPFVQKFLQTQIVGMEILK